MAEAVTRETLSHAGDGPQITIADDNRGCGFNIVITIDPTRCLPCGGAHGIHRRARLAVGLRGNMAHHRKASIVLGSFYADPRAVGPPVGAAPAAAAQSNIVRSSLSYP